MPIIDITQSCRELTNVCGPHGGCPRCDADMGVACRGDKVVVCEKCEAPTTNPENEYGEFICESCEQNAAEDAYERYCEDFHDGGSTQFRSLLDQQIEAMKLK